MMKTRHATRKKTLPAIAQKFPKLAMTNETADSVNKTHPAKSIWRLLILRPPSGFL